MHRLPVALLALALLCIPDAASAARLDLSPGSDLPALLGAMAPGDEAVLAAGAYLLLEPIVLTEVNGSPEQPVQIRGEGTVELIIGPEAGRAFDLRDVSSVWIQGLTLRGSEGWEDRNQQGVRVRGTTEDVRLEGLSIHRVTNARIRVEGESDGLLIRRCELHGPRGSAVVLGCGSCQVTSATVANNWIHGLTEDDGDGIRLLGGNQGAVIVDNVLHDLAGDAIELGATWFGPANTCEGNVTWNAGRGLLLRGTAVVRNNLFVDSVSNGVYVQPADDQDFDDVVLVSNTIAGSEGPALEIRDQRESVGFVVANNVVANPTGVAIRIPTDHLDPDATVRNNLATGAVDGLALDGGHVLAGNGYGDFAAPEARDFYPGPDSALSDAAWLASEAWLPATDFNGLPRDDAADIGAYELSVAENPGWLPVPGFKEPTSTLPVIGTVGCSCQSSVAPRPAGSLLWLLVLYSLGRIGSRSRRTSRTSR